ncbi:hypothetical protein ASPWEDRAFT_360359 [Aspergillus wentii DTO 134E9]|uniref:Sialidase n=1 Tax=Aspergillus wentii DTO 134E9 TaxID=1073089 RepID=A0A1L9RW80_ASPWE|nr:uncharacterized protein ASPWEDRAFT_360359 [Aspergillus wentii DTO 134E9]OJJ39200.1 hypothetical protein ASPWEDRAFT_360359 [Aspergillus wentii DTO 134E9]
MSLEYSYYRPTTPPGAQLGELLGVGHCRSASDSSIYSNDSSPWSVATSATSPRSPPRHHHGPALLPKIRLQDVVVEPVSTGGPQRHRRVLSNTRNPPGFVPYPSSRPPVQHNIMEPADCLPLVSPISTNSVYSSCNGSALSSPVSITPSVKRKASGGHSRSGSGSSVDEATLGRYGYPTYRQLPKYISPPQASPTAPITPNIIVYPSYSQSPPLEPVQRPRGPSQTPAPFAISTPQYSYSRSSSAQHSPVGLVHHVDEAAPPSTSTTLLSYLTGPTQAINLVRNVSVVPTRGLHDYFWWDIRNLRSWKSFSLPTFNAINGLTKLLKTEIPSHLTPPVMVPSSSLAPESEPALVGLIRDIYAPRVNAALAVSQGPDHLRLYPAPNMRTPGNKNYGGPHFLANYASDTERTSSGLPRGRLVGVVKSFDRWNTGMRNEAPHRRVEYLNGLAHLQRCMREHSCRYGFIMTEIELVCVRAGCDDGDDVPYFGYLEISAPIPTKTAFGGDARPPSDHHYAFTDPSTPSSDGSYSRSQSPASSVAEALDVPMTASLALYFLLMLSKSVPLPSQPSAHLNVGGPGALTRQRILPEEKDKWIPQPQIGERRDAKRVRGWVWPQDAWHRREGGGVPRTKVNVAVEPRPKKWHK